MENVEPLRFILVEHRGDNRINERLYRTVAQGKNKTTPVEECVTAGLSRCERFAFDSLNGAIRHPSHDQIDRIADKREKHGHAVTNLIDHEAEKDDRNSEGPDSCPHQFANLCLIQSKLCTETCST